MLDVQSLKNAKNLAELVGQVKNPLFINEMVQVIVEFANSHTCTHENQVELHETISKYIADLPPEAFTEEKLPEN